MSGGILKFKADEVDRLLEYGKPLHWGKDTGTFLAVWFDKENPPDIVCAYTEDGFHLDETVSNRDDMDLFSEIWDTTRSICGGDDFLEGIEALPAGRTTRHKWLIMEVEDDSYGMYWSE